MPKVSLKNALIVRWLISGPRPVRFALGLAAVTAGVLVVARPTTSLDLLATLAGIGAIIEGLLAGWEAAASKRWRIITMSVWISAGVFLLLAPWLTVLALTVAVGLGLGAVGLSRIVLAVRGQRPIDERIVMITFGVAALLFAVIVSVWRDISMIVVAVAFGAWLIITGVQGMWQAIRGRRATHAPTAPAPRRPIWRVLNIAVAVVTVAAAVSAVSATVIITQPGAVADPFYAAPRNMPEQPGTLIHAEPFTTDVPEGARGWRMLYTTTADDGSITTASALVVAPDSSARHPVISWAHGTTGYAQSCAPSLLERPFASGSMYMLRQVISHGWALVATDYPGLGTEGDQPYLVGKPTGYAVLDAHRAALQLDHTRLSRRSVIWGHSQGGHGALWAAQLAQSYAPELVTLGVAAVSPAGDLPGLVDTMSGVTGGAVLASFVLAAYVDTYPDVRAADYVRPGSELAMSEYPKRCLSGPQATISLISVAARVADREVFRVSPKVGRLGARLRENVPTPPRDFPVMLATGTADALLSPAVQRSYAASLCDRGISVDERLIEGADHISMLYSTSRFAAELRDWTADRFAQQPAATTCAAR